MDELPTGNQIPIESVEIAKPIHLQRLEAALNLRPFLNHVEQLLNPENASDSESDSDAKPSELSKGDRLLHGVVTTREERQSDRQRLFNFNSLDEDRGWLKDVLLSSTESESNDEDESPASKEKYIKSLLKEHLMRKKYSMKFYKNPAKRSRYMFYGTGVLGSVDRYPDRFKLSRTNWRPSNSGGTKLGGITCLGTGRGRRGRNATGVDRVRRPRGRPKERSGDQIDSVDWEEKLNSIKEEDNDDDEPKELQIHIKPGRTRKKGVVTKEVMTMRRRRLWQLMCKKEVSRVQKSRANAHKDTQTQAKRLASLAARVCRQRALLSQKNMKETMWRCKRLSREMQAYWKRYDRAERETRRRMEKEAEEQRKMDIELMEAKRQRRKLNFLITQTELYAHFMQRKMISNPSDCDPGAEKILQQLDEDKDPRLSLIDTYDSEEMKMRAESNARAALAAEAHRAPPAPRQKPLPGQQRGDYPQPNLFRGTLKGYQLKGMNWLASLYDQGISGILADEMGLGKTVQCIAFLCHCAEVLGVWGPFLVVSPASTLHNWQQELARFAPEFSVVPYWGSPGERKILRQFWERRDLHTRTAKFHVVVTSYQIVVSDLKYLNRIAWQYMILDEAQAIKSSASMRWKLLLDFSCRNRLLLSGTPIQNSMAELWALLHFIMPTLFDSHDEFNEWFSKDIESHAENKSTMDEKHLSRLHMILKPFMLRRIKKDVENELSDKIEIMVHCPLTIRQKLLYIALKKKIKIEELLNYTAASDTGHNVDKNFTSNLMNLVMQFRKVCNHPELFERRDVKSPFYIYIDDYNLPKLIEEEGILVHSPCKNNKILYNTLSLSHVASASEMQKGPWGWARFMDLSPQEMALIVHGYWMFVIDHLERSSRTFERIRHRDEWWYSASDSRYDRIRTKHMLWICAANALTRTNSHVWRDLLFVEPNWPKVGGVPYGFYDHTIHFMTETVEHRSLRARAIHTSIKKELIDVMDVNVEVEKCDDQPIKLEPEEVPICEFVHTEKEPMLRPCQKTELPSFLYCPMHKAISKTRALYAYSRSAAYRRLRHEHGENKDGWQMMRRLMDESAHRTKGWNYIVVPDKNQLVSDAGKLTVLDSLLKRLKESGHRVLIYSQMTKMIDLLEEYMWHRKHKYMRLDGSSKISARRDMVADFQARSDIFAFLLSTRAGGLGINLTAADTVIFYDSDWNPTVDQQAMDRAHRLGQTKQVTVYRLICRGTIEERIVQRATEKSEIQRMVISGGNFKPDTLKPKEVVSLLLDDDEIITKYRQRMSESGEKDRKRKSGYPGRGEAKRWKKEMTPSEPPSNNPSNAPSRATSPLDGAISPANSDVLQVDTDSEAPQSWSNTSWREPKTESGWVRGAVGRAARGRTVGTPGGRGRPRTPRSSRPRIPASQRRGPGRPRGGRRRARDGLLVPLANELPS